jgi:hypothetical protein
MFFMELAVVRSVVGVRVTEGFDLCPRIRWFILYEDTSLLSNETYMFRRSMDDQIKVFLFIRGA